MLVKLQKSTWKIFSQEDINRLEILASVKLAEGVTLISLDEKLKRLKCGIQNGIINTENVLIEAGDAVCWLRYV